MVKIALDVDEWLKSINEANELALDWLSRVVCIIIRTRFSTWSSLEHCYNENLLRPRPRTGFRRKLCSESERTAAPTLLPTEINRNRWMRALKWCQRESTSNLWNTFSKLLMGFGSSAQFVCCWLMVILCRDCSSLRSSVSGALILPTICLVCVWRGIGVS